MKYQIISRCFECGREYSRDCTRAIYNIYHAYPTRMTWCISCQQTTAHEYEVSYVH